MSTANDRISDRDVERISNRVVKKLLRYAAIGLFVWFVVLPLLMMFFLGVFSFSGARSP